MNTIYLDVDGATHQANSLTNIQQGLRLVALTMRDNGGTALYSAAWVENDGRAWDACHDYSYSQLVQWVSNFQAQGWEIKVLTSTETLFAAVVEATTSGTQVVYDLTDSTLSNQLNAYQKPGSNFAPRAIAIYGAPGSTRRYAVVFEPCEENWAYRLWDTDAVATQAISAYFNDLRYRPTLLTYSPDGLLFGVFRDDSIGTDKWTASNGLSAVALTATFSSFSARGLWPLSLSVNDSDTFACVMVTIETPLPRQFSVSGSDMANLAGVLDPLIQNMMQSGWPSVGQPRVISIAIAYRQRLVFAKAYTWADPTYPVANPISLFRMASCSKPITSIAIGRLLQDGLLTDTDTVSMINLNPSPGGAFPAEYSGITVAELRSHRSGLQPVTGDDATIAAAYGHPVPISIYEFIAYSMTNATISAGFPSSTNLAVAYQNCNYELLGLLVRTATNGLYSSYVQAKIFSPLGLTRPCAGASLHAQRATLEVQHHSSYPSSVGSNLVTADPPMVGSGYGTGVSENFEGFEDWSISTVDYAALLAAVGIGSAGVYPVLNSSSIATMFTKIDPAYVPGDSALVSDDFTQGGLFWQTSQAGVTVFAHDGSWSVGGLNIASWVISRSDGVSAAVFMNMDDPGPLGEFCWGLQPNQLQGILDAVTTWPEGDLFPSFGIPAFGIPIPIVPVPIPRPPGRGPKSD
jgi:CubicO group peptidase (beta-lactamase class C family)